MATKYFTKGVFDFLKELEANNERPWWEDNKERYINVIREPALEFINDFDKQLTRISDHFVADSRTVGGSLMRPYRDVRFSKDKTPYKTNIGIQFRHEAGKDVHAPGLYLHIEPASCFAGSGMWHPEPKVSKVIRQAIYEDPQAWRKATKNKSFTDTWTTQQDEDEYLKRVPKEFDGKHPYPDDLRLRSFIAGSKLTQKQVTSQGLDTLLGGMFKKSSGLVGFLCDAIGIPF